MEEMIDAYLAFAAGEGEEQPPKDVAGLLERLVKKPKKHINLISAFCQLPPPVFPFGKTQYSAPSQTSSQMPFAIQQKLLCTDT